MKIDHQLTADDLLDDSRNVLRMAAEKSRQLDAAWDPDKGSPVFTVNGRYTTRGWTEWTQGFQYGCLILAGEGTGDVSLVEIGRDRTIERMLPHVTHTGVHDHGFNNLSTYGNLLRLMHEGLLPDNVWERTVYEQAIAVSGAVQAARWTRIADGRGFVHSFNGPHSLFIDTMRTIRILGVAHQLGHVLMGENDVAHNLLHRLLDHALVTADTIIFHGDSGHSYDIRGRTAHEGVFNTADGNFRCRSTQQGYSPFSTWTRGLAWAMLGYAEQLEFLARVPANQFRRARVTKREALEVFLKCAIETCDHYIQDATAADGVTYWDDGAPLLSHIEDWRDRPADPENPFEPVDSSASAIAAQGLLRLGNYLGRRKGKRYRQAALSVASTLFQEPYLATSDRHEGLLLHSIYHWPNRWDHIPRGATVARGESSLWGDYHLLELANLIKREALGQPYPTFFLSDEEA